MGDDREEMDRLLGVRNIKGANLNRTTEFFGVNDP
jgi:hypothetical protein